MTGSESPTDLLEREYEQLKDNMKKGESLPENGPESLLGVSKAFRVLTLILGEAINVLLVDLTVIPGTQAVLLHKKKARGPVFQSTFNLSTSYEYKSNTR